MPVNDLIQHDEDDETGYRCVCGPQVEAVKREDGTVGWVITHHALDGRP
jgi:hypothetical protein